MADIDTLLNRWQRAGVLDREAATRIRAFEEKQEKHENGEGPESTGEGSPRRQVQIAGIVGWQGLVALILGAILLASGVALFVSAHWDQLGPMARYAIVIAMVTIFHLAGGVVRKDFAGLSTTLHAVGTLSTGAAIALVGQIFNIQEHWPTAVLMWALAALAGWILLRDQAQQTLTLLLAPAWMLSEIAFRANWRIGQEIYIGRFLFVWAILYLTFFLGSKRRIAQGILFAAGAIAAVTGTAMMLDGWQSLSADQSPIPFSIRFWAWVALAALPLAIAAFHGHKGLMPIALAVAYSIALPWCYRSWTANINWGNGAAHTYTRIEPNFAAHALVAAFTIFLCWWGVHMASKALVNLGILGFAISAGWFYYSDIWDKMNRSLGLIGLGVLFLSGGWALEKMRRRILAGMDSAGRSIQEAK
jgi:uncharacterized membrane protein